MLSNNGIAENSPEMQRLVAQLNDPNTANALRNILKHADLLEVLIEGLDGVIRRGDVLAENVGSSLREFGAATDNGNGYATATAVAAEIPQLISNLPALVKTGNKLSALAETPQFDQLFQPEKLAVLNKLVDQLSQRETLEAITQIIDNAPLVAVLIKGADGFLRRGDEIAGNLGDTLREAASANSLNDSTEAAQLVAQLPDLLKSLPKLAKAGTKLAELTDAPEFDDFLDKNNLATFKLLVGEINKPETLSAIAQIIQLAPVAAILLGGIDGFFRRGDTIMENIAQTIREAQPSLSETNLLELVRVAKQLPEMLPALMKNLPTLLKTGARLAEITESAEVQAFLDSKMLSPQTIGFLGDVGEMVVQTRENFWAEPKEIGVWGLYRAMNDPDLQRGLGFIIELGRNFGKMTEPSTSLVKQR